MRFDVIFNISLLLLLLDRLEQQGKVGVTKERQGALLYTRSARVLSVDDKIAKCAIKQRSSSRMDDRTLDKKCNAFAQLRERYDARTHDLKLRLHAKNRNWVYNGAIPLQYRTQIPSPSETLDTLEKISCRLNFKRLYFQI